MGISRVGEFGEDAITLGDACPSEREAHRIEPGVRDQAEIAVAPGFPDGTMPLRHSEVGAADASAFGPPGRVGAMFVAAAGGALGTINAVSPIADAEAHAALVDEKINVGGEIAVPGPAPEAGPRRDHPPCPPGELAGGQQLLERGAGLVERLGVDEFAELEICADISAVGHDPRHMPEMMLQGVKAGSVALADESGEGLTALMGGQMPGTAIGVCRQGDEWCEGSIEPRDEAVGGKDVGGTRIDDPIAAYRQPKLGAPGTPSQRLRKPIENIDGAHDRRWGGPQMRLANVVRGGLEDAAAQVAEIFAAVGGGTMLDTSRLKRKNLGNPCPNQVRNGDEAGFVDPLH